MMKKAVLFASLGLLFSFAPARAEVKVGVVSFDQVGQEYTKSKKAYQEMKIAEEKTRQELTKEFQSYKKLMDEAQAMERKYSDPALNETARAEMMKQGRELLARANVERKRLDQIKEQKESTYLKSYAKVTREVQAEIATIVKKIAEEKGFLFVVDSSGKTRSASPVILVYPPTNDITNELISRLNAGAK